MNSKLFLVLVSIILSFSRADQNDQRLKGIDELYKLIQQNENDIKILETQSKLFKTKSKKKKGLKFTPSADEKKVINDEINKIKTELNDLNEYAGQINQQYQSEYNPLMTTSTIIVQQQELKQASELMEDISQLQDELSNTSEYEHMKSKLKLRKKIRIMYKMFSNIAQKIKLTDKKLLNQIKKQSNNHNNTKNNNNIKITSDDLVSIIQDVNMELKILTEQQKLQKLDKKVKKGKYKTKKEQKIILQKQLVFLRKNMKMLERDHTVLLKKFPANDKVRNQMIVNKNMYKRSKSLMDLCQKDLKGLEKKNKNKINTQLILNAKHKIKQVLDIFKLLKVDVEKLEKKLIQKAKQQVRKDVVQDYDVVNNDLQELAQQEQNNGTDDTDTSDRAIQHLNKYLDDKQKQKELNKIAKTKKKKKVKIHKLSSEEEMAEKLLNDLDRLEVEIDELEQKKSNSQPSEDWKEDATQQQQDIQQDIDFMNQTAIDLQSWNKEFGQSPKLNINRTAIQDLISKIKVISILNDNLLNRKNEDSSLNSQIKIKKQINDTISQFEQLIAQTRNMREKTLQTLEKKYSQKVLKDFDNVDKDQKKLEEYEEEEEDEFQTKSQRNNAKNKRKKQQKKVQKDKRKLKKDYKIQSEIMEEQDGTYSWYSQLQKRLSQEKKKKTLMQKKINQEEKKIKKEKQTIKQLKQSENNKNQKQVEKKIWYEQLKEQLEKQKLEKLKQSLFSKKNDKQAQISKKINKEEKKIKKEKQKIKNLKWSENNKNQKQVEKKIWYEQLKEQLEIQKLDKLKRKSVAYKIDQLKKKQKQQKLQEYKKKQQKFLSIDQDNYDIQKNSSTIYKKNNQTFDVTSLLPNVNSIMPNITSSIGLKQNDKKGKFLGPNATLIVFLCIFCAGAICLKIMVFSDTVGYQDVNQQNGIKKKKKMTKIFDNIVKKPQIDLESTQSEQDNSIGMVDESQQSQIQMTDQQFRDNLSNDQNEKQRVLKYLFDQQ